MLAAAKRAGIDQDYAVKYIEKSLSLSEQVALDLLSATNGLLAKAGWSPEYRPGLQQLMNKVEEHLIQLARFNDPRGLYSLCFCDVR